MTRPRRIGLFGGTFDPVHLGHLAAAEAARISCSLDEVRFIPCRISPHKTSAAPTPAADRIAMLSLATKDLPWAVTDDVETKREGPSFSWQTAEEIHRLLPGAELFWIMGTDQWKKLPTWAHPEILAQRVTFAVVHRDGSAPSPMDGYSLIPVPCSHPASASTIRNEITRDPNPRGWLPPAAATYIHEHGLYRPPAHASGD
jgi:nicotinate-nucleotide adenylyltransferase